jgi:hypothetical protein
MMGLRHRRNAAGTTENGAGPSPLTAPIDSRSAGAAAWAAAIRVCLACIG